MGALPGIVLTNAATATGLGLLVALASRRLRRPQMVHALWMAVLLDLLAPPVLRIGLLPLPNTALHPTTIEDSLHASTSESALALPPRGLTAQANASRVAVAVSIAGSGLLLALALARARRFHRLLRGAPPAPQEIQARTAELAAAIGVRHAPRVRLVPGRISPLLRPGTRGLEILFPAALLPRLSGRERDALLVHELAHVRRRDHWTRLLEVGASLLFWWHPLVYGARSALRRAEEQCCDCWVLRVLPGHARDYAQGLLKTVEWMAGATPGLPVLASGIGSFHSLEERLTMILKERASRPLSRRGAWAVATVAFAAVLVFPTWADRSPQPETARESNRTGTGSDAFPAQEDVVSGVEGGVSGGVSGGTEGGVSGGVAGGVEGGVAGGVEGGVAGGVKGGVAEEEPSDEDELEQLRHEMLEIERDLRRLQERHESLQQELARRHAVLAAIAGRARQGQAEEEKLLALQEQLEARRLASEARLEGEGQDEEASRLASDLALRKAELGLARASDRSAAALDLQRRRAELQREELRAEVERRMEEMEIALRSAERRSQQSMIEAALQELRGALRALSGRGEAEAREGEAIRREIERLERHLEDLRKTRERRPR